jgi:hypothetical protein
MGLLLSLASQERTLMERCHPIALPDYRGLVIACLRRWKALSKRCRKEENTSRHAWIDLGRVLHPYLEGRAAGMLRGCRIKDRSLADEVACTVFATLATGLESHLPNSNEDKPQQRPAESGNRMLKGRLRTYYQKQRRQGEAIDWDSLHKFLEPLLWNEVRKVVQRGRNRWRKEQSGWGEAAVESPVTEDWLRNRLAELDLTPRLREHVATLLDKKKADTPRDSGFRMRSARVKATIHQCLGDVEE